MTIATARTKHRMDVFSQLPRPPFFDFASFAHIGRYMLSPGNRDCLLDPWIRPTGTRDGRYLGQQLNPASARRGWAGRTIANWNPHGTAIAYWEQERGGQTTAGQRRARLLIARLPARRPTQPARVRPTPDPAWAPRYEDLP